MGDGNHAKYTFSTYTECQTNEKYYIASAYSIGSWTWTSLQNGLGSWGCLQKAYFKSPEPKLNNLRKWYL